jgi:hypothetical protein
MSWSEREDNIKIGLNEIGKKDVDSTKLGQDTEEHQTVAKKNNRSLGSLKEVETS